MENRYPTTRHDLLARVQASRAELERLVGGLGAEQLDAPGPGGGWSIKDHLYHLAAWERKALAQLRGGSIPAALGIDQAVWDRDEIDEINGAIQARCRDLPPAEALAFSRESHQELLRELARYPEADYGEPGYPDWAGSAPMIAYIAGNSYEHFAEHGEYIKRLAYREAVASLPARFPADKASLLVRIQASRAALEALIAPLTEEQLAAPSRAGGWSIKDHLYHLATWQQVQLARMQGRPEWSVVELDEATYRAAADPATDFRDINAIIEQRGKHLTVAAVLAYFRAALAQLLAELDRWTYADLLAPFRPNGPTRLQQLSGDSYEHDDTHRVLIERDWRLGT